MVHHAPSGQGTSPPRAGYLYVRRRNRTASAFIAFNWSTPEEVLNKLKLALVTILATWSAYVMSASSIVADPGKDAALAAGKNLVSPNGQFTLVLQGDGNAVVYRSSCIGTPSCAVWQSATSGKSANPLLVMQGDGNLVIYNSSQTAGRDIFSIGPSGNGTYLLMMQDDGNLVVYSQNRAVWSSFHGKVPDTPPPQTCGGNDLEKLRCKINDIARANGLGNILDGSRYTATNTQTGACTDLGLKFPGGDIGLERARKDYPADKDYAVKYGSCPSK